VTREPCASETMRCVWAAAVARLAACRDHTSTVETLPAFLAATGSKALFMAVDATVSALRQAEQLMLQVQ
jgi:hypothetical protein